MENPLLPAGYDMVWSVLFLAVLVGLIVLIVLAARMLISGKRAADALVARLEHIERIEQGTNSVPPR